MLQVSRKSGKIFYKDLELTKAISVNSASADSEGILINGVFFTTKELQNFTSLADCIKSTLDLIEKVNTSIPTLAPYPTFAVEKQQIINKIDSIDYV